MEIALIQSFFVGKLIKPRFLLQPKAQIDKYIIKLLLTYEEIDVNNGGNESNGTRGGTSIMFSHNSTDKSPLCSAIEKENLEIIKLLLTNKEIDANSGANDESSTDGGDEVSWHGTPLYKAVEN